MAMVNFKVMITVLFNPYGMDIRLIRHDSSSNFNMFTYNPEIRVSEYFLSTTFKEHILLSRCIPLTTHFCYASSVVFTSPERTLKSILNLPAPQIFLLFSSIQYVIILRNSRTNLFPLF